MTIENEESGTAAGAANVAAKILHSMFEAQSELEDSTFLVVVSQPRGQDGNRLDRELNIVANMCPSEMVAVGQKIEEEARLAVEKKSDEIIEVVGDILKKIMSKD